MAALSDHRQYLSRKQEAERVKEEYISHPENHKDYSLKPGEKIKIQLPKSSGSRVNDKVIPQHPAPPPGAVELNMQSNDDEWGDFISS